MPRFNYRSSSILGNDHRRHHHHRQRDDQSMLLSSEFNDDKQDALLGLRPFRELSGLDADDDHAMDVMGGAGDDDGLRANLGLATTTAAALAWTSGPIDMTRASPAIDVNNLSIHGPMESVIDEFFTEYRGQRFIPGAPPPPPTAGHYSERVAPVFLASLSSSAAGGAGAGAITGVPSSAASSSATSSCSPSLTTSLALGGGMNEGIHHRVAANVHGHGAFRDDDAREYRFLHANHDEVPHAHVPSCIASASAPAAKSCAPPVAHIGTTSLGLGLGLVDPVGRTSAWWKIHSEGATDGGGGGGGGAGGEDVASHQSRAVTSSTSTLTTNPTSTAFMMAPLAKDIEGKSPSSPAGEVNEIQNPPNTTSSEDFHLPPLMRWTALVVEGDTTSANEAAMQQFVNNVTDVPADDHSSSLLPTSPFTAIGMPLLTPPVALGTSESIPPPHHSDGPEDTTFESISSSASFGGGSGVAADQAIMGPYASGSELHHASSLAPNQVKDGRASSRPVSSADEHCQDTDRQMLRVGKKSERFLLKLVAMLDGNHEHIKWSADGTVIIITNSDKFQENELKKYLRTASYSSFVRQLNLYGFDRLKSPKSRKLKEIDASVPGALEWHFSNPHFLRGRLDLLDTLHRKPIQRDLEQRAIQRHQQANPASTTTIGHGQQHSYILVPAPPHGTHHMAALQQPHQHQLPQQLPPMPHLPPMSQYTPLPTPSITTTTSDGSLHHPGGAMMSTMPTPSSAADMGAYNDGFGSTYGTRLGPLPPPAPPLLYPMPAPQQLGTQADGSDPAADASAQAVRENIELRREHARLYQENVELRGRMEYFLECMAQRERQEKYEVEEAAWTGGGPGHLGNQRMM